ncbi:Aste57867_16376 [Aphanomyces stellatus]|uniref:Aste57867_16376 protein n=1 Tax=Aphanomyces stellatus TaxID=120398 RepID=A0A485L697_9STRA|nr:hypothetical protein As57867_016319 [Aphanomyces stellatus]VFT93152.1 Aste57867_16376 [Aphanomyces stellatus]
MSGDLHTTVAVTERTPLVTKSGDVSKEDQLSPFLLEEVTSLVHLAAPIIFTLVMEFIPNITNIILVGHLPVSDVKSLVDAAAIATVFAQITALPVGFGMATALDTLCTQAYGAGHVKKFGILLQSALLGMALTLIPVVIVNWFTADILVLLGQDPSLAALAGRYIRVRMLSFPALFCFEVLKKFLQAEGVTSPTALMVTLGNIIHVTFGLVLTQCTPLGIVGAPAALCLAEYCLLACMLVYLCWVNPMYKVWDIQWSWAAAWSHVGQFFHFGVPGMLMMMIEWGAIEILALVAGVMPKSLVTIAVNSVLAYTAVLGFLPYLGLSIAATIRIGNLLGANQPVKAHRVFVLTLRLCFGCAFATAAAILLLSPWIPSLVLEDPAVVACVRPLNLALLTRSCRRTATALIFIVPLHVVDAMNTACQGCFRAMGKQAIASAVTAAGFYAIGIPLAVYCGLYLEWSVEGLWAGYTLGSLSTFAIYQILLSQIDWKQVVTEAMNRE